MSVGKVRHLATAFVELSAPCGACGRPRRYSYVVSSGALDEAGPRAPPSIDMLQTVMRFSIDSDRTTSPVILDAITDAATRGDLADEVQDHIFGRDARGETAIDAQLECFGFRLQQRLSGHDVLHFTRADAERKGAESAMGRRMAVATNDRHAGLGIALLQGRSRGRCPAAGRGCRTA